MVGRAFGGVINGKPEDKMWIRGSNSDRVIGTETSYNCLSGALEEMTERTIKLFNRSLAQH